MKKKIIIILLCILPIIIIYKSTYVNKNDYLALGDGLSLGWTHYGTIGYGYTDYIRDYLDKKDKLKTYNKSFSEKNITVVELISKIESNEKTINNSKEVHIQKSIHDSEIITLSIGNNEISNIIKFTKNSKESYVQMNKIINKINYLLELLRNYNQEQIFIIGFYSYGKEGDNKLVEYMNNNIKIIAKKNKIDFVDINSVLNNKIEYLPNSLENYPSNSGYKAISKEVIKKLKL